MRNAIVRIWNATAARWKQVLGSFGGVFGILWTFFQPLEGLGLVDVREWGGWWLYGGLVAAAVVITLSYLVVAVMVDLGQQVVNLTDRVHGLTERASLSLVDSHEEIIVQNIRIIEEAQQELVAVGSRADDAGYLAAISLAMRQSSSLIHYRILYGNPRTQQLKDHLIQLARDFPRGSRRLFIGLVPAGTRFPEAGICASETSALVVLPSYAFNWALAIKDEAAVGRLLAFAKVLHEAGTQLVGPGEIEKLPVVETS